MAALAACVDEPLHAEQELTRLYEAHAGEIFAFCRHRLSSQTDAEDATQTTFLYALRALRRGVVPDCEAAWLTAIAKNVCHTQRRTLDRRGPLASDADLDQIALAQPVVGELEWVSDFTDALYTLPDNQRTALVLREWLGLAPKEIAPRLGLTPTATTALVTRARRSFVTAFTTSAGRPLSAVNVAVLVDALRGQLKALLAGASSKVAIGAAVAGVAAGGIVVERSVEDPVPPTSFSSSEAVADATPRRAAPASTGDGSTARQVLVGEERGSLRAAHVAPIPTTRYGGRPAVVTAVDSAAPRLPASPRVSTEASPGSPGRGDKPAPPVAHQPELGVLPGPQLPSLEIQPPASPPAVELPGDDLVPPLPDSPLPDSRPGLPAVPNPLG